MGLVSVCPETRSTAHRRAHKVALRPGRLEFECERIGPSVFPTTSWSLSEWCVDDENI